MLIAALLLACAPEVTGHPPSPYDPMVRGDYPVAHKTVMISGRTTEIWYPTNTPGVSGPVADAFLADPAQRDAYEALLAEAPPGCPSTDERAVLDVPPARGPFPLLVYSHCHGCVRFSSFTVLEQLASHGYVVAAPDHAGNTLWDNLAGALTDLDTTTLDGRVADQVAVLDAMLSDAPPIDVVINKDAVGAIGHSFGSVTTGRLAQTDARIKAAFGIAAPMENPLFPTVKMADIHVPVLFLLAQEDHSISELGNIVIRNNAASANPPVWLLEVADAGHWSFSDIAGLTPDFMPGCGEDTRQTNPSATFSYLPIADAQRIAGGAAVAFFDEALRGEAGALAGAEFPAEVVVGP